MPATGPVTPDTATPEHCQEAVTKYADYLVERTYMDVRDDPARANKVERSLQWIERSLAYWIGCLLEPDGSTDPVTDEVRWQISVLRKEYAGTYTVPDIEAEALRVAQSMRKHARTAARASVERRQARQSPPQPLPAPSPSLSPLDELETTIAASRGLTLAEYRASKPR